MKKEAGKIMKLKRLQTTKVSTVVSALLTLALMCVASFSMAASVTLEKIDFASLSGNRVEMRLEFDGIPPDLEAIRLISLLELPWIYSMS